MIMFKKLLKLHTLSCLIWAVVLFACSAEQVNARLSHASETQEAGREHSRHPHNDYNQRLASRRQLEANSTSMHAQSSLSRSNDRTNTTVPGSHTAAKLRKSSSATRYQKSAPMVDGGGTPYYRRRTYHRRMLRNNGVNKGDDDLMRDVEHIGAVDWRRNDVEPTTTSTTTTTEASLVNRRAGEDDAWSTNQRNLESRHICMQQKTIQVPVKTTEVYTRPIWKHVNQPCQANQMCTRVQLIHEQAYRDVIRHKATKQVSYDCCPGWTKVANTANACMKPTCSVNCRNGGTCVRPDTCRCTTGYSGKYCEKDINECKDEKPCDQLCFNTEGSYYCQCREGFTLQADKQSCRKVEENNDDAFEARDLENEIDSNEVTSRLHKIERTLAADRNSAHELQRTLQQTYHEVDSLKARLNTLEKQRYDFNHLESNLLANEAKTKKLEHLLNVLFKCNTHRGPYCP